MASQEQQMTEYEQACDRARTAGGISTRRAAYIARQLDDMWLRYTKGDVTEEERQADTEWLAANWASLDLQGRQQVRPLLKHYRG